MYAAPVLNPMRFSARLAAGALALALRVPAAVRCFQREAGSARAAAVR
jgi:hypothetical protein